MDYYKKYLKYKSKYLELKQKGGFGPKCKDDEIKVTGRFFIDKCKKCGPNSIKDGKECVDCGENQIKRGNECVECGENQIKRGNECVECGPDEVKNKTEDGYKCVKCFGLNKVKKDNQCFDCYENYDIIDNDDYKPMCDSLRNRSIELPEKDYNYGYGPQRTSSVKKVGTEWKGPRLVSKFK